MLGSLSLLGARHRGGVNSALSGAIISRGRRRRATGVARPQRRLAPAAADTSGNCGNPPRLAPMSRQQNNLTLRSARSARLEGWAAATILRPILRDASLRDAPQDEVVCGAGVSESASPAVENVVAEILHLEDGGVGAAGGRFVEMGLDHLADHDVMVALLDDAGDLTLDRARRIDQERRAGRALAVGLSADLAVA